MIFRVKQNVFLGLMLIKDLGRLGTLKIYFKDYFIIFNGTKQVLRIH